MDNLVVSTRKKIIMDKMFAQVKISAANNIKSVLNVSARAQIGSCDCTNGAVSISGKITANIVYVSTENKIETATASADFIEKQKAGFALTDAFAECFVVVESVNFSSNEAMIAVSHTANVEGVFNYEIPKIDTQNNSLMVDTNDCVVKNIKAVSTDDFVVNEDYQTGFDEAEVLSVHSNVLVQNVTAGTGKVVVEGKVLTETIYMVNGSAEKLNRELEFKQEIESVKSDSNATADASVVVKNMVVSVENRVGKVVFVYNVELSASVYVFEDVKLELVEDLYSLTKELTSTYSYFNAKKYKSIDAIESIFNGQVDISAIESLDDVLFVVNNGAVVDEVIEKETGVEVLCKQQVCVVYKTETAVESLEEVLNFKIDLNKLEGEQLSNINLSSEILSFKVKAGREVEVTCKYLANVRFETEESKKYIASYEVVGDKVNQSNGIKVYVAKGGQTVFEVAKILNVTPETIKEQNEIDEVFESGQKIYVYSPVNLA